MALWHLGDNFTSDIVVLAGSGEQTQVLLIRRKHPPYQNHWALPGGFLNSLTPPGQAFSPAETPEAAAIRELEEETGVIQPESNLQLIGVYDAWGRDPRAEGNQRVVTHAYLIQLSAQPPTQAGDDAADAQWFHMTRILSGEITLAFDHADMLQQAWIIADPERQQAQQQGFMRRAIALGRQAMQRGEGGPFGAVVVKNGQVIGEGWNQVLLNRDPTAHGEIMAIRAACQQINHYSLANCELYTSGQPCPMCNGASHWARLARVYYGFSMEEASKAGFDDLQFFHDLTQPPSQQTPTQIPLLPAEATALLTEYSQTAPHTPY